jgi:hypothetical protein
MQNIINPGTEFEICSAIKGLETVTLFEIKSFITS